MSFGTAVAGPGLGQSTMSAGDDAPLSYVYYGTYPTRETCTANGVGYSNAHNNAAWICLEKPEGHVLYVDDGTTD
ncbi:hypothetical protein HUO13_00515 [Saccharopolyspora erythraea]|uniref:hypothetical protein n=1 Tax=Saccharopolyspora erythraea TaxID=1836 RepID=UPI001BA9DD95|nr:hypothetical protein [Saccharopolyspora erythraea]QUG99485.1 hypothetical protein HUO13_00515 [Saccharopolyspora erythraea]